MPKFSMKKNKLTNLINNRKKNYSTIIYTTFAFTVIALLFVNIHTFIFYKVNNETNTVNTINAKNQEQSKLGVSSDNLDLSLQEEKIYIIKRNIKTINADLDTNSFNNQTKKKNRLVKIASAENTNEEIKNKKIINLAKTQQSISSISSQSTKYESENKKDETTIIKNKINDVIEINGQQYKITDILSNSKLTAFDNGEESTGKSHNDEGYGITASGEKTHWGTAAIDTRYHDFGDLFYIVNDNPYLENKPNKKIFVAEDKGSAVKGKNRLDLWFSTHKEAINFGKQYYTVYKIEKIE